MCRGGSPIYVCMEGVLHVCMEGLLYMCVWRVSCMCVHALGEDTSPPGGSDSTSLTGQISVTQFPWSARKTSNTQEEMDGISFTCVNWK